MYKVLIVDDSLYMRTVIRDILEEENDYEIVGEAGNGETAIELAKEHHPDVITLDNVLPDMMGLDILKELNDLDVKSKVIMISAVGQRTMVEKGKELGAVEYIVKPFESIDLINAINNVLNP